MADKFGFVLCIAGLLLGAASYFSLGWAWGILAVCLIVAGVLILRRHEGDGIYTAGEAIDGVAELADD